MDFIHSDGIVLVFWSEKWRIVDDMALEEVDFFYIGFLVGSYDHLATAVWDIVLECRELCRMISKSIKYRHEDKNIEEDYSDKSECTDRLVLTNARKFHSEYIETFLKREDFHMEVIRG